MMLLRSTLLPWQPASAPLTPIQQGQHSTADPARTVTTSSACLRPFMPGLQGNTLLQLTKGWLAQGHTIAGLSNGL